MNIIVTRDKETERQREWTLIPGFFVHMNTRAHFLKQSHKLSHPNTKRMCVCVCVRARRVCFVIAERASSRRARQFMGRVPWPDIRVQIRETSKQVVVRRCGLTSECLYVVEDLLKALVFLASRARYPALDRKRAHTL